MATIDDDLTKQEAMRQYVLYTGLVLLIALGGGVVLFTDIVG
jgi:hypothetical protein